MKHSKLRLSLQRIVSTTLWRAFILVEGPYKVVAAKIPSNLAVGETLLLEGLYLTLSNTWRWPRGTIRFVPSALP